MNIFLNCIEQSCFALGNCTTTYYSHTPHFCYCAIFPFFALLTIPIMFKGKKITRNGNFYKLLRMYRRSFQYIWKLSDVIYRCEEGSFVCKVLLKYLLRTYENFCHLSRPWSSRLLPKGVFRMLARKSSMYNA